MPKHIMHYDFNDFERFIREDLARQGYQVPKGSKPEIIDLKDIEDFANMAQVVMTVLVVPTTAPAAAAAATSGPGPALEAGQPSGTRPTETAAVTGGQPRPKQKGGRFTNGWYAKDVQLTPEQLEARRIHRRAVEQVARDKRRQAQEQQNREELAAPVQEPTQIPAPAPELVEVQASARPRPAAAPVVVEGRQEVVAPSKQPFPDYGATQHQ